MINKLLCTLPAAAAILFILLFEPPHYSLPLIAAVLLHESSHLLVQRLLCGSFAAVRPVPFGLSIPLAATTISYKKELLICAAGPLSNFLCSALCVFLMHSFGLYSDGLLFFLFFNLLLGLVNLLPIKTLDGGRILLCFLLQLTLPHKAEIVANIVSLTIICILWTSAVYLWITIGHSPYLIFLSIYLFALSLPKSDPFLGKNS